MHEQPAHGEQSEPHGDEFAAALQHASQVVRDRAINQRIFETSLDLILVVDRQGNFIRVSPSAEPILGYLPEDLIGKSAVDFIYPDDLESTREEMRLARRGRLTRHFDSRYVHSDGSIVHLSWTGVWSEPEEQHFFIGRDMTERIKLERQLRQAQKMEAIGQLTGGIAHDSNNLLAIVIGNIDLIMDQPELSPQTLEFCGNVLHAAQRGAELNRQLLAFARQQPLLPKAVDTNALIANIITLLSRTIGQHIDVSFTPGSEVGSIVIDAANLEAAITNLALNARDAMAGGGRLIIETQNATLDADYAESNPGVAPGGYVVIIVTDTGSGMSPELVDRIFEPFFTTKEQGKGTGLGLSMVFGFIKQSGGHIKVYSEVGHGTSMRLYLPRPEGIAQPASEPDEMPIGQQLRAKPQEVILVVEDSDLIRRVVTAQLTKLGYRYMEADCAAAALKVIDTGAAIDLLFTDIIMPGGMDGYALAREAVARRPGLKVLFTSGFPGASLRQPASIGSSEPLLNKPYRAFELARKLREALDRQ